MTTRLLNLLLGASLVSMSACSSGPTPLPTPVAGEGAEVTVEGLYKMDNTVMQMGYAKPDLDLSGYTAFMLDPVRVAYQKDPAGRNRYSNDQNFALSSRQMENLKEIFHESVTDALTEDGGYELVDEPAPNVLRINASLIDLVVRVPTEVSGRESVYAASYGEVTLILELYDSQSGEILALTADRQDPTRSNYQLSAVEPAFVRADVTRLFEHWASTMRERLDQIREIN